MTNIAQLYEHEYYYIKLDMDNNIKYLKLTPSEKYDKIINKLNWQLTIEKMSNKKINILNAYYKLEQDGIIKIIRCGLSRYNINIEYLHIASNYKICQTRTRTIITNNI